MLNVFIIDDSHSHAQILYDDLKEQPEINDIKIFHSCSEAALPLLEAQPDVIFLDIEMPGRNGLEFIESIKDRFISPVKVVFYSAFSQYILDALRHQAFDFLLKPYKIEELRSIIERLMADTEVQRSYPRLPANENLRKLAIQTVSNLLLVTVDEVLHLQYNRAQRAWMITLTDGNVYRIHQNTTAEDLLQLHPSLARVSQGCIVNLTYLTAIENNTQRCIFCPPYQDIEVYASRRNFAKLKEKFDMI